MSWWLEFLDRVVVPSGNSLCHAWWGLAECDTQQGIYLQIVIMFSWGVYGVPIIPVLVFARHGWLISCLLSPASTFKKVLRIGVLATLEVILFYYGAVPITRALLQGPGWASVLGQALVIIQILGLAVALMPAD
jgi:hypothetical protein